MLLHLGDKVGDEKGFGKRRRRKGRREPDASLFTPHPPTLVHLSAFLAVPDSELLAPGFVMADGKRRPIIITAALRDTSLVSAVRHAPRDGALMTLRRETGTPRCRDRWYY